MTAKRSLFNGLSDALIALLGLNQPVYRAFLAREIAHRPALIQSADRILVLEEGRIVAAEIYDELIDAEPRLYLLIRETDGSTHFV